MVGIICPPVEIGLTDLPKSGGAMPPPPSPQSTVSEMQHAKLEFRTFMNFVIILQKKNLMKLPYSVSLKQENCRRLWCKLIDTTWKISKVMITYLTTYIHSVLHISNGPTTSLFKRSHSVSERFYISIFPCLLRPQTSISVLT